MTDLQDHPVFFFQIQFIYLFFTGKLLLLQNKSCYYMYIFRLPICKSPLLFLFQKSVVVVMNITKKKKKKKMTHTQVWVKIKSYATIALLSIFSLGKGREILTSQALLNTLKKLNSVPSDLKTPTTHLFRPPGVCDTPQNCPTL